MPHLILQGTLDLGRASDLLNAEVVRWGRAVLKIEDRWRRHDGRELLVQGVVVELSRPLHPVAMVSPHERGVVARLWSPAPVERTPAVQRWLAWVARRLQDSGAGPVLVTNVPAELREGLGLVLAPGIDGGVHAGARQLPSTSSPR